MERYGVTALLVSAIWAIPQKTARRVWNYVSDLMTIHVLREPAAIERRRYSQDFAEITFLVDHPLDSRSVVFDVGAHVGNWLARIVQRYDPVVHAFEVHPRYCEALCHRFGRNGKVTIHQFGLGYPARTELFADAGPATRVVLGARTVSPGVQASCVLEDPSEVIARHASTGVALMALNIEGGEYEVLDRLLDSGAITLVENVMVQFHDIDESSVARREAIRSRMELTHFLTFKYGEFWENWRRRVLTNP